MSFGDPNNPYGPPPGQPPAQPPGQPGYGYPQQPPAPQQGYPQQPGYPGFPGGNQMLPMTMPGLLMTARVFLFLIAAVQIIIGFIWLYVATIASDISDAADSVSTSSDDPFSALSDGGDLAAGVLIIIALVVFGFATLSILLGVKFSRGGQGIRITTVVYGALGGVVGLIALFGALDSGLASAIIFPLIWVVFAVIITIAPVVPSGTAWFARPRY
ncbi:hypothetical protein [Streptomyces sp. SHP 1-2]|uniref:hypothetical protein n=1 Tax=Streptomyces sp. SHP 1-2 TaxID=2769489 RepID=UPI0022381B13|nr:hypothetical protein [Streptomyces sp. SHP 1-2]MCW5251589.1 hypothetical protein [Streptomyces sp. SHP 1-2]